MVDTVFINGEVVVEKGRLLTIDEEESSALINKTTDDFLKKASKRIQGLI